MRDLRLYVDEDAGEHAVIQGLRVRGIDVLTIVLHSDMATTGTFECSNPLINQLQRNIVWAQKGNFVDVPTDFPHRDERLGWTGDAQVFIRTACFNMNTAAFSTKWLRDLSVDQLPHGRVGPNTQTAYVLALHFDALPEPVRPLAVERLVEEIRRGQYHVTTGFVGTPYLCHVLSRFGHTDGAYRVLNQERYPSWLYPVIQGATTIWERWDGIKPDSSFQTATMNSFNH